MKPLYKGLLIALLHLLMVSSLGAKLLYDRSTRPRVWVKTAPYDPSLPIRGRYVRLRIMVEPREFTRLGLTQEQFEAVSWNKPVAFFIPEHVQDPSQRPAGEELWVEVTVPKKGPPRPIRLGVKKGDGEITPLDLN